MRHLLLTEQWFPNIGGSIQLFDEIYGKRFPPGELMHVIGGDGPGSAALDASYRHPVTRFSTARYEWLKPESLALYARMAAATARAAIGDRADVLHCARVIPEGLVAYGLKQTLGLPYVVWVHGEEVSMYLRYPGKAKLMPKVFGAARAVICNSSFSRARALEAGAPEARVHVVNPCVEPSRFAGEHDTAELVERFGLAGKTVLISVGRLTRRKGHDHVLRALAQLRRKDIVYLVLSDGELEDELKREATALGLDDVVRWVGPVQGRELPRYYAAADVFVMPNRTLPDGDVEGFGMVFLEASAAGLPVIAGRSGGAVDAVNDGVSGLLVDGGSVDAVASALATLLDDRALRERLGAGGRAWVERAFAWDEAARRVRAIAGGASPDTAAAVDSDAAPTAEPSPAPDAATERGAPAA